MEEKKYRIGQYEFDTYEEYLDGLDDVKQIQDIIHEMDIKNPDDSVNLYELVRSGKVKFKGKVGDGFFFYLSDVVAGNTKKLSADRERAVLQPNSKWRLASGILLIAVAVICFIVFAAGEARSIRNARRLEELQAQKAEAEKTFADTYVPPFEVPEPEETADGEGEDGQETKPEIDRSSLTVLPEYEAIYEQNADFIGWLSIDDTTVNYPVMQIVGDNSYYLTHSFEKTRETNGTLFLDGRADFINRSTNLIIYGHNMKSGEMFGTLKNYLDEGYYYTHQTIKFDTIYERAEYTVVGVCLSEVEYQDEDAFRYYDFIDAGSEEEFNEYLENINALSAFGPVDVSYGDQLLTLSTCNSYVEDGRMFVLAKRAR